MKFSYKNSHTPSGHISRQPHSLLALAAVPIRTIGTARVGTRACRSESQITSTSWHAIWTE